MVSSYACTYFDIHFNLQVVYIYYNPWQKHLRNTVEKETDLSENNFIRVEESSMCVVREGELYI